MGNLKIKSIKTRQILDSRGKPTVEVEIETNKGKFSASAASGTSEGKYEAVEIRDKNGGVKKAINNIKRIILPALKNKEIKEQKEIDEILIGLDGTENKSRLGANAILPVSIAVCRALAAFEKIPLYKYIRKIENCKLKIENWRMPLPCFNIINGGAHTKNGLDIQEFMVVPQKKSFRENFKTGNEIYLRLKDNLLKNFGEIAVKTGLEGGFIPPIHKTEEVLYLLSASFKNYPETKIGLDCAASSFYKEEKYNLDGRNMSRSELLDFYQDIVKRFPIIFIEDPFSQDDWEGFKMINQKLNIKNQKLLVIGDDLTATNKERVKKAINNSCVGGIIIKPDQIGTVSETLEAVKIAKEAGLKIIVSHRSGETSDDFIADLAVGVGADFIKAGAPLTKERMVKYNRLLEIENNLTN